MNIIRIIAGSLRQFLVRHWFWFALAGLVLIAAVRQNMPPETKSDNSDEVNPPEKRIAPSAADRPFKITEKADDGLPIDQSKMFGGSSGSGFSWAEIDAATRQSFLKRFSKVAMDEQKKFGIPASVILGCGFVQSHAGTRDLAREANNFFAAPGTDFLSGGKKYASFKTAWDSFRANSLLLDRHFQKLKRKPWKVWAAELAKVGYSDLPDFEAQLTQAILENRLDELDGK